MEQAWHCLPFSEAARYGIELFYPYPNEFRVSARGGSSFSRGTSGRRPQDYGGEWPPFRTFGDLYYTYQLSLDLKVEEGFAIRTEPHPRFYTDPTNTTPLAVPALLRRWWPMVYFLVFKSPPEGGVHMFRPGEPFVQVLVLPEQADFELAPMPEEEAAERELQSRRIYQSRSTLSAGTEWTSATNTVFDGTYRHILGAATEREKQNSARRLRLPRRFIVSLLRQGDYNCVVMVVMMIVMMVVAVVPVMVVMMMMMMMMRGGDVDLSQLHLPPAGRLCRGMRIVSIQKGASVRDRI